MIFGSDLADELKDVIDVYEPQNAFTVDASMQEVFDDIKLYACSRVSLQ